MSLSHQLASVQPIEQDLKEFLKLLPGINDCEKIPCAPTELLSNAPKIIDGKLWAIIGNKYVPCEQSVDKLPSGYYTIEMDAQNGLFFKKQQLNIDNLLELPDSASEKALMEIEKFWTLESHYREHGFLWKRGFMLWGPPGSGKTSTVQIVIQKIIQRGGIAVSIFRPDISAVGLKILRNIEPKRPIVAILEDIDSISGRFGESDLLAMLDGEHQIDNVVMIATTNYPERLDPRIINRPSRFDTIYKIGMPSLDARIAYMKNKSKLLADNEEELLKWAQDTDGFSIAHIKELIISVNVFNSDYKDTLDRLRIMAQCRSTSSEFETDCIGFAANMPRKNQ